MAFTKLNLIALLVVFAAVVRATDEPAEEIHVDEKAIDYAKGSLCGYCRYCTVSIPSVSGIIAHQSYIAPDHFIEQAERALDAVYQCNSLRNFTLK